MATPDKQIPDSILRQATCVGVVPGMLKGAFVFGAEYGQGVVTCRTPRGWSAPVFIRMEGGSWGFQIGGQGTDLVLVAVNEKDPGPAAQQVQNWRRCLGCCRPGGARCAGFDQLAAAVGAADLVASKGCLPGST